MVVIMQNIKHYWCDCLMVIWFKLNWLSWVLLSCMLVFDVHARHQISPQLNTVPIDVSWWQSLLVVMILGVIGVVFWLLLGGLLVYRNQLHHTQRALNRSNNRLALVFNMDPIGDWDWRVEDNGLLGQRFKALGYQELSTPLSIDHYVDLIHANDRQAFIMQWRLLLSDAQAYFNCTYRIRDHQGRWIWFHDIAQVITRNQYGAATRVMGIYVDMTELRNSQEQAQLFVQAFEQTRDWMVILNPQQLPIAANYAFRLTFGLVGEQQLPKDIFQVLGIDRNKCHFYTELIKNIEPNQQWGDEELVISSYGKVHPVEMTIDAVMGKAEDIVFYVVVLTDITAQKAAENDLRQLANYDRLTGLPNRALLLDRIKHAMEHARRYQFKMALFFIDLDRFKRVNDYLGHEVGDRLLIEVSSRLNQVLREEDTVARLVGDEFVILLESYQHIEGVNHVAEKILMQISQPMVLGEHKVSMSASIGIALYPEDARKHSDLLKNADVAMYHAKEAGRNGFQYFTKEMNERAKAKLEWENAIKLAFLNEEFVNFYQPIVDVNTNHIKGFEVLIRWQSENGMILPQKFISVAEDIGLIIKMTQRLLRRGLADLRAWYGMGYQPYLSVNLSVKDLEQESLASGFEALLLESGLPVSSIRFEITESALMIDRKKAVKTMDKLKELGFVLALDDFGTGYSSLKYLKEFPIEIIKIDQGFIQGIGKDNNDEAIIDSIMVLANSLGMQCIAEGVETIEQLRFLTQRNCRWVQGYYFAKPEAYESATRLLSKDFNCKVF